MEVFLTVSLTVAPLRCAKPHVHTHLDLEARVGIEPTHKAFAEPCLTTWLPRHSGDETLIKFAKRASLDSIRVVRRGACQGD